MSDTNLHQAFNNPKTPAHIEDECLEACYAEAYLALQHASKVAVELGAHHGNWIEAESQVGRLLILAFRAGRAGAPTDDRVAQLTD